MSGNISFNPQVTTNALGSFNTESTGYVQGVYLDDPAIRYQLAGGILDSNETLPMWGGAAIYEFVAGNATPGHVGSPSGPSGVLGGIVGRATATTGAKAITGFSVFNQAYGMTTTPQSPVPLAASGMQVNFFRLGSRARIPVKCDPTLAAYAGTNIITQPVAWDFVNQMLIPLSGSINISSASYDSGTGVLTLTLASPPSPLLSPGDTVTIAGVTGTGNGFVNGVQTVLTNPSTTLTIQLAASLSISGLGSGTLTTGAALSVDLLDFNTTNSMVVDYDPSTGFATWDRNGPVAVIQI